MMMMMHHAVVCVTRLVRFLIVVFFVQMIATGDDGGKVRVFNLGAKKPLLQCESPDHHKASVLSVCMGRSPNTNKQLVVSGCKDNTVHVYEFEKNAATLQVRNTSESQDVELEVRTRHGRKHLQELWSFSDHNGWVWSVHIPEVDDGRNVVVSASVSLRTGMCCAYLCARVRCVMPVCVRESV